MARRSNRCRRWTGWAFAALAGLALTACSPPRAIEAGRILADFAAGDGPSSLKRATPEPRRQAVDYRIEGRARRGDLYLPGDAARAALVLVPGAARAGKDDPRLVAFAKTLARARFAVLIPDIANLRTLRVSADDASDIGDAVGYLVGPRVGGGEPDRRVGVAAISFAAGPALIAALEGPNRDRIGFVLVVGGYYDLEAAVTFFTTGWYRERPAGPWRYRPPNPYGKWVFARANADRLADPRDRTTLAALADRKLADAGADVSDLVARLGDEGRRVYALLTNRDRNEAPALIAALPAAIRADLAALDLKGRDLSTLEARLILVHGRSDPVIPASQSQALAAAAPPGRADLFVVDGIDHVAFGRPGLVDSLTLWRAVYRVLEERDAAPYEGWPALARTAAAPASKGTADD